MAAGTLWLIDGYNVLRVSLSETGAAESDRWWTAGRRQELIELAGGLAAPADEVCLVFDAQHLSQPREEPSGAPAGPASQPALRCVFAPSADDWIVAELRARADSFARRVVVSADRKLANRARDRGAEIVSTGSFVALCRPDAATASGDGVNEGAARETGDEVVDR